MSEEVTSLRGEDELPAGGTYQQRVYKQMRREIEEVDQEWIRQQKLVDYLWQQKLDAEAPLDDEWDYSTGYAERRHKVTCHRGRWDPDF
jgi:hypothetical protein